MPARTLLAAVTLLVASVSPGWGDSCSSGTVLMSASPVSSFQETLWMNAIPGTFGSVSLFGDYSIGSTTFGPFIGTTYDSTSLFQASSDPILEDTETLVPEQTYDEGFQLGRIDGYEDGYTAGLDRGQQEGAVAGEADGFDQGWNVTYQPAYDTAFPTSLALGRVSGWHSGFRDEFGAAVEDARATFGSAAVVLDGFSSGGVVSGEGFIEWNKFSRGCQTGQTDYDDGYDDGYDEGFVAGDQSGFDDGYDQGYEAAFDLAFTRGSEEGQQQGTADGSFDGRRAGGAEGRDAAEALGYQAGAAYAQNGGDLYDWSHASSMMSAQTLFDLHPEWIAAADLARANLATSVDPQPVTINAVPEPSGMLILIVGLAGLLLPRAQR